MKRRTFLAINLPESAKKKLKAYQEKLNYLPVRWTKEASLHLTLVFIGYISNEQMLEVCQTTRKVASESEPFFINFKRIILGPPILRQAQDKLPRMIWVEGEANSSLTELKNKLQQALLNCNSGFHHIENRPFKPHITLARIKMDQWRKANIERSLVEKNFEAQVLVNSIEVMESDLRRDGAEYVVLESCELGQN